MMKNKLIILAAFGWASSSAHAGLWEVSGIFGWNRSNYIDGFTRTIRYGGSVSYRFNNYSELEGGLQKSIQKIYVTSYQDTVFEDLTASISWIQNFSAIDSPVQPYLKAGVAQLNRDQSGTYLGQQLATRQRDIVTIVLGAGVRVFVTKRIALRSEFISYLEKGSIRTFDDNISANFGLSLYF